jgi:nitrate reductase delta subunit
MQGFLWFRHESNAREGVMSIKAGNGLSDFNFSSSAGTRKGIALSQLGQLLAYPDGEYLSLCKTVISSLTERYEQAGNHLKQFVAILEKKRLAELEELYTRTFDLAALTSPYITGYIYGDENFDRGTLMAVLGEEYDRAGFDRQGELPDHLSVLLRFCSWLDEETLEELIEYCLKQPVSEIAEQLKQAESPYFHLVAAVRSILVENDSGGRKKENISAKKTVEITAKKSCGLLNGVTSHD